MVSVAVIGAGVIGLSTAVRIQQTIPGAVVTVFADKFFNETTSHGAAGIFRPTLELMPGVSLETARKWVRNSWDHYDRIVRSEDAKESGMSVLSGYHIFDGDKSYKAKPNLTEETVYCFRRLTEKEHSMFPKRYENGYFVTTIMVETTWYLPYLVKRLKENNGQIVKRTVQSLQEFCGEYDVVVNCAGLRSKELLGDTEVHPIRGQMLRVKAPWIKHFYMADHFTWIVPGIETCVVGGTRQVGSYNTEVNEKDKKEVWERACRLIPSLRKAEVQWVWAGLRPQRSPIRVESQTMKFNGKKLKVVHNYGHGGNGVTLSWGTACAAADLVKAQLQNQSAKL